MIVNPQNVGWGPHRGYIVQRLPRTSKAYTDFGVGWMDAWMVGCIEWSIGSVDADRKSVELLVRLDFPCISVGVIMLTRMRIILSC